MATVVHYLAGHEFIGHLAEVLALPEDLRISRTRIDADCRGPVTITLTCLAEQKDGEVLEVLRQYRLEPIPVDAEPALS